MRRSSLLLALLVAACGGHTAAPSTTSAPAAAPSAPAASRDPATLRYAAGTSHYRIETTFHSVTEVMGNSQVADGSILQWVSATLAPQGDNMAADFTLDSVTTSGQMPPNQADPASLRGKVFHAVIGPNGRTISVVAADTSTAGVAAAAEGLREFFPALPPGSITAGQTWIDTTTTSQRSPGTNISSRAVRTHRVVGWEDRGGSRTLHVATTTAISLSGDGEAQGQPIQLAGTGTGSVDRFITSAGMFQSQAGSDSTNINVTVISMGLEIPVRQTRRTTVTRLP